MWIQIKIFVWDIFSSCMIWGNLKFQNTTLCLYKFLWIFMQVVYDTICVIFLYVFQTWIYVCYKWIVCFELSKVTSWILCNSKSLHDCTIFVSCKCHVVVFWQGLHFVCFVAIGRSYSLEGHFWSHFFLLEHFVILQWFLV